MARRITTGKASLGIEYDLRNRAWAHLLRQPRLVLRPLADRPAHEPPDERRPERAHVPRLRPHLLHHQHRDDGRRGRHPLPAGLAARAALHGVPSGAAARDPALQPEAAPHPAGRAAEDRRRHRGGRGERGGLAHRAHLRARGRRAGEVQPPQLPRLRGQRGRRARARRVHPADRLHPQPGRRLPAVLRRPPGHRRADDAGRAGGLLQLPDDVRVPGAGDRLAHGPDAARHRQRQPRVRAPGRAARDGGATGCRRPALRSRRGVPHRRRDLRARHLRLRRPAGAGRREPRRAGRPHRRPRGTHRLRQDHADQPHPAVLRPGRGHASSSTAWTCAT